LNGTFTSAFGKSFLGRDADDTFISVSNKAFSRRAVPEISIILSSENTSGVISSEGELEIWLSEP